MKKAVGYLRRSTDKQEQSLEDQKREILSFAKREGFEMTGWYADDAISGAFSENRSQFQAMVLAAQEKTRPFDLIIAYDIARFSRGDNIEVGYYLHILRNAGVEVLYVKENLKGDDMDEILRPVFQFNANLYLKSLSRDTIRGQVTCAREARFLGGPVPYGYKRIVNENGKSSLILDSAEKQAVVRRIFESYARKEMGYRNIADALNQEGIPAPRGGTWTISCLRSLLMNPIYYGAFVWNRRTLSKFHSVRNGQAEKKPRLRQEKIEHNPESEWFVKENVYPVIIKKDLWLAAQEKRKGRSKFPSQFSGRATTSNYLLSGLITCGRCGHTYFGTTRTNSKKIKTHSYTCGGFWSRGNAVCENFSFASHRLEGHILQGIKNRLGEENPYKELLGEIRTELDKQFKNPALEINALEQRVKAINQKIDDLLDTVDPEHKVILNRKITVLSEEKKRLEVEIVSLKANSKTRIDLEKASREVLSGIRDFDQIFTEEASVGEKKAFIRRYIGAVRILPKEKKALVGWYPIPKPSSPVQMVAGAGFEPATFGLCILLRFSPLCLAVGRFVVWTIPSPFRVPAV
ncbi:MAG TPA: recombinase family protein [Candidatus Omnitrophota bacterium]|nr:recombinase family protein [Candidatus Omnitrophota bacterium]HRY85128.1 recombinase family protein [Candidatus Omnitrophota bacterium]